MKTGGKLNRVKTPIIIAVFLIALFLSVIYSRVFIGSDGDVVEVEIREYEGEKLDSINVFRENSIKGPQKVNISDYRLWITGHVEKPVNFTYQEVINSFKPHTKIVTLYCVEGWSAKILWEGVSVNELLEETGISNDARAIIFHAVDGYTTSLPMEYIKENDIIIAYKMNGVTIPPERGFPFQLVAESKWGYKWIKWIDKIILSTDEDYRGFWESRGYSNEADLDKGFFE